MKEADDRPLQVAMFVAFFGLLLCSIYHYVQASTFGQGYPKSTFLFMARVQFTDLFDVLRAAKSHQPYTMWSIYFPAAYIVFYPLAWLQPVTALIGYAVVSIVFTLWFMYRALPHVPVVQRAHAAVVFALSYPLLFCIDRGNVETIVFALMGAALIAYSAGRETLSAVLLAIAGSLKLYPLFLAALYFADRRYRTIVVLSAVTLVLSVVAVTTFDGPLAFHYDGYTKQMTAFNDGYIVGNGGMGHSVSLFATLKLTLFTLTGTNQLAAILEPKTLQRIYGVFSLACVAASFYLVVFRRTTRWRAIALLVLPMLCLSPVSGDYKLMHVLLILAAFLQAPREDQSITDAVMIALLLVPKDYVLFSNVFTDSGLPDVSSSVVVNPLLIAALWVRTVASVLRARPSDAAAPAKTAARQTRRSARA